MVWRNETVVERIQFFTVTRSQDLNKVKVLILEYKALDDPGTLMVGVLTAWASSTDCQSTEAEASRPNTRSE